MLGSRTPSISQLHMGSSQGERGNYCRGTEEKGQSLRGTKTIFGNSNIRKQIVDLGGKEQANLFQRNKETGTPPPP